MRTILLCVSTTLALASSAFARPITFDDLYSIPRSGSPRVSPDGRHIAYVVTTSDPKTNTRASHIWMMAADGSNASQLTTGKGESSPQWTVDGKAILFLADRGNGTQVWRLPLSGGEAQPVATLPTGIEEFGVAPDGDHLILVTSVFPDCQSDSCNRARRKDLADNPNRPKLIEHLLFRHYNHWDDGSRQQIVVYSMRDGDRWAVPSGAYDAPTTVLGGGYTISPDGREICFPMCTDSMPAVRVDNNLYIAQVGAATITQITNAPGIESEPQYSPDGRFIGYVSRPRPGYESDEGEFILYDRKTKTETNLTEDFDRSLGSWTWSPDSKSIYFSAIEHGFNKIWRLNIASDIVSLVVGDAVYSEAELSPTGQFLVAGRSVSDEPEELYRIDLGGNKPTRLTHLTDSVTASLTMTRAEVFWFAGSMGDSIHGFLTKPPGFDPSKKYPLALLIHGGPQFCWLGEFNYYGWNTQLVAAQGYVVAQFDPHGSTGYGIKFQEYVSGHWGMGDYEDLMKGVDYLIASRPFIDSTRMAALGRSYGGFMTNWICGHTDRFRCLVTIDGTFNHMSDYGATDELWFPEWEYKGTPWTNRDEYVRSSPSTYAANFKTPTLVIHGQRDYRLDVSEAFQMFTTLQRLGVPSQLLYLPDESHNASKLENLRIIYARELEWLARWLK